MKRNENKKKTCTPKPAMNPRKSIVPTHMSNDGSNPEKSLAEEMKKFIAEAGEASDRRVQSLFEIAEIKKSIEWIEARQANSDKSFRNGLTPQGTS